MFDTNTIRIIRFQPKNVWERNFLMNHIWFISSIKHTFEISKYSSLTPEVIFLKYQHEIMHKIHQQRLHKRLNTQFFCKCVHKTLHVSSFNLDTSHDDITDGNKCSIWPCTFIFYLLSMQYIHQIVSKYYPRTLCSTMIFPINSYEQKRFWLLKLLSKYRSVIVEVPNCLFV